MSTIDLRISLTGPDPAAIVRALVDLAWFPARPAKLVVDGNVIDPSSAATEAIAGARTVGTATAARGWMSMSGTVVKLSDREFPWDEARVLAALAEVPFHEAVVANIHRSWYEGLDRLDPPRYEFGAGHFALGAMCAFKGDGHRNLVSRRWLERGPWRIVLDANDVSLVQFHDLAVDAVTALREAAPGHVCMIDGHIAEPFEFDRRLSGSYSARDRRLWIHVVDREVTPSEMMLACAVRRDQILREGHIDAIAFQFIDEATARRQLHDLWMRDLECWTYVKGAVTRLDADYVPRPPPPVDWVEAMPRE